MRLLHFLVGQNLLQGPGQEHVLRLLPLIHGRREGGGGSSDPRLPAAGREEEGKEKKRRGGGGGGEEAWRAAAGSQGGGRDGEEHKGLHRRRGALEGCAAGTAASPSRGRSLATPFTRPSGPGTAREPSLGRGAGGDRRTRRRPRGPRSAGLPWLLWGLAPGAAPNWPPSPPTWPGRHVGRKRRVTQRPNGCRGGSGGSGRRCQPRAAAAPAGRGRRAAAERPSRSATAAWRGLAASRVRLQGGAGRGRRAACGAARGSGGSRVSLGGSTAGTRGPRRPLQDARLRRTHFPNCAGIPSLGVQPLPLRGSPVLSRAVSACRAGRCSSYPGAQNCYSGTMPSDCPCTDSLLRRVN